MDPTTLPPEYSAVLVGAVALYGTLSFVIVQVLRRVFPIESNTARIFAAGVAFALGAVAAVHHALPLLPDLPFDQKVLVFLAHMGGAWWASQEIYRRLRADTWKTRKKPWPPNP